MADVTSNRGRRWTRSRDRGQLILVTGLLIAVAMVALVLLLNTAIYTENLASRGTDQSGREAVEYRATVVEGVGGLIDAENDREHVDWNSVNTSAVEGIATIDNYTARSYALGGTAVQIGQSSLTTYKGRLIRQTNPTRSFQNRTGGSNDWEVASGVDHEEVRDFRMTVSRSSLETNDDDALNVYLDDGSTTWQAFVYDDGSSVTVATSIDGASKNDVCSIATSETTVDLTRGTIAGEPCPDLNWAEGLSGDYNVEFRNGENATGTYDVTFNITGATINGTNVDSSPSMTVYHVPAVYSATFDVSYETPTLTYRSEVRVASGEPR